MQILPKDISAALIIGHPGHELRVHGFVSRLRPRVYVFTDGSGYDNQSRIDSTIRLIRDSGAVCGSAMGEFSDRVFYDLILSADLDVFKKLVENIAKDLVRHQINLVFGDAIEGFSPTHDLCRYLINAAVSVAEKLSQTKISNYDFLLEGHPADCPPEIRNQAIWLELNKAELDGKINAGLNYLELTSEVEEALMRLGRSAFKSECLRPVLDPEKLEDWPTEKPYYEVYGEKKVEDGQYDQEITFKDHLKRIGEALVEFGQNYERIR